MFKRLFSDSDFKPDGLKIYPCQVIKGAGLEKLYYQRKYKPYNDLEIKELVIKIMRIIPNYCRVMRIMREIPSEYLVAGTRHIGIRKDIEHEIRKENLKINEIRFREIGFAYRDRIGKQKINQDLKLKITKYKSSDGDEYFLEIVNKNNILFGLCRLRIKKEKKDVYGAIRELHVYGQSLPIGQKGDCKEITQHKGLGKQLVKKAEEIAKSKGVKQLDVIAGIGVRQYFYEQDYKPKGPYVSKTLK